MFGTIDVDPLTHDESRLIEENLVAHTAFAECVLETDADDRLFMLHFENTLARPPEWNKRRVDGVEEVFRSIVDPALAVITRVLTRSGLGLNLNRLILGV